MESEWDKEPVSTLTLERREDPSPSKTMCMVGGWGGEMGLGQFLPDDLNYYYLFFFFF